MRHLHRKETSPEAHSARGCMISEKKAISYANVDHDALKEVATEETLARLLKPATLCSPPPTPHRPSKLTHPKGK